MGQWKFEHASLGSNLLLNIVVHGHSKDMFFKMYKPSADTHCTGRGGAFWRSNPHLPLWLELYDTCTVVHAYVSENPSPSVCSPFVLSVYTSYMKVCLGWGYRGEGSKHPLWHFYSNYIISYTPTCTTIRYILLIYHNSGNVSVLRGW